MILFMDLPVRLWGDFSMSMLAMLGMLGAGALSSGAALYTNKQNLEQQLKVNTWSQQLADSAHQREVLDLYKAGLNPILSASGSGASVPSLGAASLNNPGQGLADGISSASNLISNQYRANVANIKANTEQVNTVNSALKADREVADIERDSDRLLADARHDAVRRLTGHEDSFENGRQVTTFNYKKYNDYVDSLVSGMKSAQHRQNWQGFQSWLPFINGGLSGLNSAAQAHQTFKYTRKFFK